MHGIINHMEEWERQLLQQTEILVAPETIMTPMNQSLIMASDGSVQDHRASYGWILSTSAGLRLIQCNGPAYGYRPTSFRAEGYGLLSVIRFIYFSKRHWGWQNQYSVICDNESMIKVMTEQFKVDDAYPNHTLSAEWNIIAEMKATLAKEELWNNIQFSHIKGHADKDKSYDKLTIQQQWNVDADKLAGAYIQQHYNDEYGIVPLLPTSGAQLNMEEGTVTHQIK
jgi:hypothetical protein